LHDPAESGRAVARLNRLAAAASLLPLLATAAGIPVGDDVPADSRIPLDADPFSDRRLTGKGR
jgi:hypothetical protein